MTVPRKLRAGAATLLAALLLREAPRAAADELRWNFHDGAARTYAWTRAPGAQPEKLVLAPSAFADGRRRFVLRRLDLEDVALYLALTMPRQLDAEVDLAATLGPEFPLGTVTVAGKATLARRPGGLVRASGEVTLECHEGAEARAAKGTGRFSWTFDPSAGEVTEAEYALDLNVRDAPERHCAGKIELVPAEAPGAAGPAPAGRVKLREPTPAPGLDDLSPFPIERAIQRGRVALGRLHRWENRAGPGYLGLMALALLRSGVPAQDPELAKTVARLRDPAALAISDTYDAALRILAIEAAAFERVPAMEGDAPHYRERPLTAEERDGIRRAADWLCALSTPGGWDYCPPSPTSSSPFGNSPPQITFGVQASLVLPALAAVAEDAADDGVRRAARAWIRAIVGEDLPAAKLAGVHRRWREAVEAAEAKRTAAIPALAAALRDEAPLVRRGAAQALARLDAVEAVDALLDAFGAARTEEERRTLAAALLVLAGADLDLDPRAGAEARRRSLAAARERWAKIGPDLAEKAQEKRQSQEGK